MLKCLGNRYTLLQRLDGGGMAQIYLGRDERLLRPVAIKVIRECKSARALFLFHREARAVAAMQHYNIVNILDYSGPDEIPAYIVMEFVQGQNIGQLLLDQGPLPVAAIMAVLRGLAAALSHAHAAGIVHRDIKPANIMVDQNGRLILTDFGLAKAIKNGDDILGKTTVGLPTVLSGTPDFLAPEQVLRGPCDAKVDIFTTGIVLYNLVTGDKPFHHHDEIDTLRAIASLEYQPLTDICPDLDPTFLKIVSSCLQFYPKARPGAKWLFEQADQWLCRRGWNAERLLRDLQAHMFPVEAMSVAPQPLLRSEERERPVFTNKNVAEKEITVRD